MLTEVHRSETVALGSLPKLGTPDAYAYGVLPGPLVPLPLKMGGFVLSPTGNPLDFSTEDGTPSNCIFVAKPVVAGRINADVVFSRGGVGTYNPQTGTLELGYGGLGVTKIGGIPVVAWLNTRSNVPDGFTGTISANLGVAFSVDQAAATAMAGAAPLAAAVPGGGRAAVGMGKAASLLRSMGQAGSGYIGAGYRVELRFKDGALDGIYYKGQKVELQEFAQSALASKEFRPAVVPNSGDPKVANYNAINQMIFGSSPWDLAAASGGKNHGNGALDVANAWRGVIQEFGTAYMSRLPADVQAIVIAGPRSMNDAGQAANALLSVASPADQEKILARLQNRYGLNFGVPAVAALNGTGAGLIGKPGDYDFVRNVFQGAYRNQSDMSGRS